VIFRFGISRRDFMLRSTKTSQNSLHALVIINKTPSRINSERSPLMKQESINELLVKSLTFPNMNAQSTCSLTIA